MAMKIKKGDNVIVIAGKDKHKEGKVLSVDTKNQTVLVEGINKVKKHMKPNQQNQQGGIVEIESPIHVSNVAYCEGGAAVKVGFALKDGAKVRINKKTQKELG